MLPTVQQMPVSSAALGCTVKSAELWHSHTTLSTLNYGSLCRHPRSNRGSRECPSPCRLGHKWACRAQLAPGSTDHAGSWCRNRHDGACSQCTSHTAISSCCGAKLCLAEGRPSCFAGRPRAVRSKAAAMSALDHGKPRCELAGRSIPHLLPGGSQCRRAIACHWGGQLPSVPVTPPAGSSAVLELMVAGSVCGVQATRLETCAWPSWYVP